VKNLEGEPSSSNGPLSAWAWGALGALVVAAPMLWPALRPAGDLPAGVRERQVPGKINVVEFVDFECPFCRMFHPTLKKIVGEYGDRVNFVQLDLPLESHAHARDAAKAHLCADEQHARARMADALIEAEDLTEKGILASATNLGLDVDRLQKCIAAQATETKLVAVESILRDSGMLQGLPTTFVGNVMLVGAQDEVALRDAFERAARGDDGGGIPAWAFLGIAGLLAGVIVFAGRRRVNA
jgi:protein-disulfide isomerase